MIVHCSSSTIYSILPVLVTTLIQVIRYEPYRYEPYRYEPYRYIPVIHCALHLLIFSICGLYPSHLTLIHNSNCDNRVIPHLLTTSIEMTRRVAKRSGQWSFNFYPSDLIKTTICQKSNQCLWVTPARHIGSSPIFLLLK